jgi:hypothetical protein
LKNLESQQKEEEKKDDPSQETIDELIEAQNNIYKLLVVDNSVWD